MSAQPNRMRDDIAYPVRLHLLAFPFILLVGLPGSGKTALATQLQSQDPRLRVVSTDAIRSQFFGSEATQGPWLRVWHEVGRQFRAAILEIAARDRTAVVYDATNAVRRQRRHAIALARHSGFTHLTVVWLDTPLDLCLARNRQRDRQVPESVILQMHRCLVGAPPTLNEGCDRLIRIPPSLSLSDILPYDSATPEPHPETDLLA